MEAAAVIARAAVKTIDMNRPKLVISITPEISVPLADSISVRESMQATVSAVAESTPGALGSEVNSNLVPPHRIGTFTEVSGSLILASPKFGTRIASKIPDRITSSGANLMRSAVDIVMGMPPVRSSLQLGRFG